MDTGSERLPAVALKILGTGFIAPEGLRRDSVPERLDTHISVVSELRDRKALKLMAKHDQLAVAAAKRAAADAAWDGVACGARTGVYFSIGYIPFEQSSLDDLYRNASVDGRLDVQRGSTDAFQAINPLMTFKCLPNMPVFHVSHEMGISGSYFVTYPGPGQWFLALEKALQDLVERRVDYAFVGAAADQRNELVHHHYTRLLPDRLPYLVDSAAVLVLVRAAYPRPARALIQSHHVAYHPSDPFELNTARVTSQGLAVETGPVDPVLSVALWLEQQDQRTLSYRLVTGDGYEASMELTKP